MYQGSICQQSVNSSTIEQLLCALPYHKNALDNFKEKNDTKNAEFFSESLMHVEDRIRKLSK